MARPTEAQPTAALARVGARVAVVTSSFHADLTGAMSASAHRELLSAGVASEDILDAEVPGSFEQPGFEELRDLLGADPVDLEPASAGQVGRTSHDLWLAAVGVWTA